jgi:hypothetical protein
MEGFAASLPQGYEGFCGDLDFAAGDNSLTR